MFPKSDESFDVSLVITLALVIISGMMVALLGWLVPNESLTTTPLVIFPTLSCAVAGMRFAKPKKPQPAWWAYVVGDSVGVSVGAHLFTVLPAFEVLFGALLLSSPALILAYHAALHLKQKRA